MRTTRVLPAIAAVGALLISCADDQAGPDSTTTTEAPSPTATQPATTTDTATTTGQAATTATDLAELAQPAIWPAADVMFATPEEAAVDFVVEVLGVPPVLGEFQRGDTHSGEIEVLFAGEGGGDAPRPRGLLILRQIEPRDDWFVIAAVSDGMSIASPEGLAVVEAGPLTVEGLGRGFEGTIVVSAFVAGDAEAVLDTQITQGGAFAEVEPYSVTLDLSAAEPGDVVVVFARGDVGLETDPGDFTAIPIVIAP